MSTAQQIRLFEESASACADQVGISTEALAEMAVGRVRALMDAGKHLVVSCSFGKDSSVVLALTLRALKAHAQNGGRPTSVTVLTSNTLMENPVQDAYVGQEIAALRAYARREGLPVSVHVASPSLTNNYLVNVIGGRMVATTPDQRSRACSNMMKVQPLTRAKRRIFKALGVAQDDVVCLVGTRFSESPERAARMAARGESAAAPIRNPQGEWLLSPIADWTSEHVFEYIGLVRSGLLESYSDFDALVQFYRDAAEGECMVSAFVDGKQSSRPCGSSARSGCWGCAAVTDDHSMLSLLKKQDYAWMEPLYRFRGVLKAYHHDLSRRSWIGRSVNEDGSIDVGPNAYSPAYCRDLLRWAMTIDVREQDVALATAGALRAVFGYEGDIRPRFRVLTLEEILGVALLWSRYGYGAPLDALREYRDVYEAGVRYDLPVDPQVFQPQPIPAPVRVPFVDADFAGAFAGFRDVEAWAAGAEVERVSRTGEPYAFANEGLEFGIDLEAAGLFFDLELEHALSKFSADQCPTAAFHYLVRLGIVTMSRGAASEQDRMLRLANQVWRYGLGPLLDSPEAILARLGDASAGGLAAIAGSPDGQGSLML